MAPPFPSSSRPDAPAPSRADAPASSRADAPVPSRADASASSRPAEAASDPVRVMVVDDSAVVRGLIIRMLESDPAIAVVASIGNGALAVERLRRASDIEVVVLDIEMPVMDGITALGKLLATDPTVQVVMASTLTQHNAEISLQALELGAADYIPKPSSRELCSAADFRRDLLAKVRALATRRRRLQPARAGGRPPAPSPDRGTDRPSAPIAAPRTAGVAASARPVDVPAQPAIALRPARAGKPDLVVIGCSTGGPQALAHLLKGLRPGRVAQPILITQHMPPTFTAILAEHLQRCSGLSCREAAAGERIEGGRVYIAPGDRHLEIEPGAGGLRVRLTQDPPENFCRPSVDPMLRSVVRCVGGRALAVILTGMGADGLAGCRALIEAGGSLVAQDQASSVVWGMPGAVATAGLCCAVEPLDRLAATVVALASGAGAR